MPDLAAHASVQGLRRRRRRAFSGLINTALSVRCPGRCVSGVPATGLCAAARRDIRGRSTTLPCRRRNARARPAVRTLVSGLSPRRTGPAKPTAARLNMLAPIVFCPRVRCRRGRATVSSQESRALAGALRKRPAGGPARCGRCRDARSCGAHPRGRRETCRARWELPERRRDLAESRIAPRAHATFSTRRHLDAPSFRRGGRRGSRRAQDQPGGPCRSSFGPLRPQPCF